jgi:DNA repair protein RadC
MIDADEGQKQHQLLASLLSMTNTAQRAAHVAEQLLANYGSLRRILFVSPSELTDDISGARGTYIDILALKCFARSFIRELFGLDLNSPSPKIIPFYAMLRIGDYRQTSALLVYFDKNDRYIGEEMVAIGNDAFCGVSPRQCIMGACNKGASKIILVENSPSGSLTPPAVSLALTNLLAEIAESLGIKLLDHIIVSKSDWLSLCQA